MLNLWPQEQHKGPTVFSVLLLSPFSLLYAWFKINKAVLIQHLHVNESTDLMKQRLCKTEKMTVPAEL